jgi:hypothetical protein
MPDTAIRSSCTCITFFRLACTIATHFNSVQDRHVSRETPHGWTDRLFQDADDGSIDGIEVNDELKKPGLRIRPRLVQPRAQPAGRQQSSQKPGHIAFDDRGNAVYEWNEDHLAEDSTEGERARRKALEHPGLSLVDDEPANAPIRNNPAGMRVGYDPYQSGLLAKKPGRKKVDLRELSKWIETRRRLARGSSED